MTSIATENGRCTRRGRSVPVACLLIAFIATAAHGQTAQLIEKGSAPCAIAFERGRDQLLFLSRHPGRPRRRSDRSLCRRAGRRGGDDDPVEHQRPADELPSDVWPAYWDGYDPAGPDDQPFLAPVPLKQRRVWRKLTGNMLDVHRQGIDFPARVIDRSRQRKISPWITLRMNDVHENANLAHPIHSPLSRRPELFRQGTTGDFARALDYAQPEVRDHYRKLVVETLVA